MRISCPSCHTEYDVSDERLAGRVVRCARCATEWTPVAEAPPPVPEDIPPPVPPPPLPPEWESEPIVPSPFPPQIVVPPRQPPVVAEPPPQSAIFAWVASLVVIVIVVAASYVWRADVMLAWPPSQRAYQALGLR
jgi:predicted Zn finger-like uncharacterized protein